MNRSSPLQHRLVRLGDEVRHALADGAPVVALETTIMTHGLSWPDNLDFQLRLEGIIRGAGAVPATIGLLDGRIVVGLTPDELGRFARAPELPKLGDRDVAGILASGGTGATTVSATLRLAAMVGIGVAATGAIGGVHRDVAVSLDISADLVALSRYPVLLFCSGAKPILDLPKTIELLETLGIPVVGVGTDRFPAFYTNDGGPLLDHTVDMADEAALLHRLHVALGGVGGTLALVPVPAHCALPGEVVEGWVAAAVARAGQQGIAGKALTPYLLREISRHDAGRAVDVNKDVLGSNVLAAAEAAVAFSRIAK